MGSTSGIDKDASQIVDLMWAAGELFLHLSSADNDSLRRCDAIWALTTTAGDLARLRAQPPP